MALILNVVKGTTSIQIKDLTPPPNGAPCEIKAQPNVKYVLQATYGNSSGIQSRFEDIGGRKGGVPQKLRTLRNGNDLQIAFDEGDPKAPDLIIRDYFQYNNSPVVGLDRSGNLTEYDVGALSSLSPEFGTTPTELTPVSDGWFWTKVIGGGALLAGGGIALAAGGGGGGGGSSGNSSSTDNATSAKDKIVAYANDNTKSAPTVSDYDNLGVTGVTSKNLSAINSAIDALAGTQVNSKAAVQAVVTAYTKITDYADNNLKTTPTVNDYSAIGVLGVTSTNLVAINSAVDALSSSNLDSESKIQTVVDAYLKILKDAKSATDSTGRTAATDPTATDFAAIGATIGKAGSASDTQHTAALNLIDDALIRMSSTQVDSIDEINAIARVVDKLMSLAASATPSSALSITDLGLLGISGATDNNLQRFTDAVKLSGADGSGIDTIGEINGILGHAIVEAYAEDSNINTAPTTTIYKNVGVTSVTSSNLNAINSSVASFVAADVNTTTEIQSIVTAWGKILSEANGSAANPELNTNLTTSTYQSIGLDISALTNSTDKNADGTTLGKKTLDLLNYAIGAKNTTDLTSLQSVSSLESIAAKVMKQIDADTPGSVSATTNISGITSSELITLGITVPSNFTETYPDSWKKVLYSLAKADIEGVQNLEQLQQIVNSAVLL